MIKKRKYILLFPVVFVLVASALCCYSLLSPNFMLEINEIKAHFMPTVHISYSPEIEDIERVEIGGAILVKNNKMVYSDGADIARITKLLNDIPLVGAKTDELPNMSPDSYIQYYSKDGDRAQSFVIYGDVFIEDVDRKILYRIKNSKGLSDLRSFVAEDR